jgi:hypothetical protein
MTSPPTLAMILNACLLVGCSAAVALWNSSLAEDLVANPTGGGGGSSVQLEPAPAGSQPRRTRAIFVCRNHAPVTFSDRPCGPAGEERTLKVHEPRPGRAVSTVPAAAPATTLPRVQTEPKEPKPDTADSRCRRLREQREKLDDQMRTGYSAREAAQLWNRWRSLNSEIYRSRC